MKILIANWVYNWGSTGYIMRDLKNELSAMGHQVIVAAGKSSTKDGVSVFSTPSEQSFFWRLHRLGWSPLRGSTKAAKRLIHLIDQEQPDVVNIHLLHCNFINLYYLLRWLGKNNIKMVITNHAEIYYTGSCGHAYECMRWKTSECHNCPRPKEATGAFVFGNPHRLWKLMKKAFRNIKPDNLLFTAVSPWVKERFLLSPITTGFSCMVTMNGLDTNTFKHYDIQTNSHIGGRELPNTYFLWVTATFDPLSQDDVKGSRYLVELARRMPNHYFVVVATSSKSTKNLPINVIIWGKAKSQEELAQLYSGAKLCLLFSRRETFSMVTAESLCCGTPVVGFKAGGPESIAIPEYSAFVEQGDVEGYVKAIHKISNDKFDRNQISAIAREKYSRKSMAMSYLEAYELVQKNF